MEFTVLMSVYGKDSPKFFREALESVSIAQTVKPNQIVIVEDGPVPMEIDQYIELIEGSVTEIKFTIIRKQKNSGLAAALNTGLTACEFEYVARMDSDDIAVSDRFKKQIEYLNNHCNISVLGGAIKEFINTPNDLNSVRTVKTTHNEIVEMAKRRTPFNHMTVLYKKSDILSVGGYSENFGKLEDYKLWVDLIIAGKRVANLEDILVNVRVGNGFIERRSNKREILDWDMLQVYLTNTGLISKVKAMANKLYIRVFIYMPSWMKKMAYRLVLRK